MRVDSLGESLDAISVSIDTVACRSKAACLEARTDIRIVFTDVDMPGSMDGLRLAAAIRDRWPPIEIIITSGHVRLDDSSIPAHTFFFPKPYDHAEVANTMTWMAMRKT